MEWKEAHIKHSQDLFCMTVKSCFLSKVTKYKNLLLKEVHVDDGLEFLTQPSEDEVELILGISQDSSKPAFNLRKIGRQITSARVFRWILMLIQKRKARQVLAHLSGVSDCAIKETVREVVTEVAMAYEYQLMVLYGDEEVVRLAQYAVSCFMMYLNQSDARFTSGLLLQALLEVKPKSDKGKETIRTQPVWLENEQVCLKWKLGQVLKQPGLRIQMDSNHQPVGRKINTATETLLEDHSTNKEINFISESNSKSHKSPNLYCSKSEVINTIHTDFENSLDGSVGRNNAIPADRGKNTQPKVNKPQRADDSKHEDSVSALFDTGNVIRRGDKGFNDANKKSHGIKGSKLLKEMKNATNIDNIKNSLKLQDEKGLDDVDGFITESVLPISKSGNDIHMDINLTKPCLIELENVSAVILGQHSVTFNGNDLDKTDDLNSARHERRISALDMDFEQGTLGICDHLVEMNGDFSPVTAISSRELDVKSDRKDTNRTRKEEDENETKNSPVMPMPAKTFNGGYKEVMIQNGEIAQNTGTSNVCHIDNNIVGNGDIAQDEQLLHFPQCFQEVKTIISGITPETNNESKSRKIDTYHNSVGAVRETNNLDDSGTDELDKAIKNTYDTDIEERLKTEAIAHPHPKIEMFGFKRDWNKGESKYMTENNIALVDNRKALLQHDLTYNKPYQTNEWNREDTHTDREIEHKNKIRNAESRNAKTELEHETGILNNDCRNVKVEFKEETVSKDQELPQCSEDGEKSYKFYGCFTPWGAKCQPSIYGFRGPLHVWDDNENKYTLIYNDKVTVNETHCKEINDPHCVHQKYRPKTSCHH